MELSKEFRFEASHRLPKHPGKCSRLHGHSWVFRIFVNGTVNPESGMVLDYYHIGEIGKKIVDLLDHKHLGSWEGILDTPAQASWGVDILYMRADFNPTSENILLWMANYLEGSLPWSKLEINETCTSSAVLTREEWDALQR